MYNLLKNNFKKIFMSIIHIDIHFPSSNNMSPNALAIILYFVKFKIRKVRRYVYAIMMHSCVGIKNQ